jgi:hypothetical protein
MLCMRGAVFLCLLLFSFILSGTASTAAHASNFAAGPLRHCDEHAVAANLHPEDRCPCPAHTHNALTWCCSPLAVHFAAIACELAFRPLSLRAAVFPGDQIPSISSRPSQVFRPPKLAAQA